MPALEQLSTPGRLDELSPAVRAAWSTHLVEEMIGPFAARFEQFYDPTVESTPDGLKPSEIIWSAFPARLTVEAGPGVQRWQIADSSREQQDEYCEWSVERNAQGQITRVTFTTEVREYWQHMGQRDPEKLLDLYRELVDPQISEGDLFVADAYNFQNARNVSTEGRLAHLVQTDNNLGAAVDLAARATILRHRPDGSPVTTAQELVSCAGLGNQFRNSDPQIAAGVNDAAAAGAEITLADPLGLYIDGLIPGSIETPDGEDPAAFWTIERGTPDHTLRASYSVPAERGYTVSDIKVAGLPIVFGAQLADQVCVRLAAFAKPGDHEPVRRPCGEA